MAFVLVQHLDPGHKSILIDLVKRFTAMPVFKVEDGMDVQPDCVYVIPPNRDLALLNGRLQLLEPAAPRGRRLPIDFFFRSLAQDQGERAICVILSGTGTDGTLGLKAVKEAGGMAMAQSPESASYDGMPRSAIATGLVDYVIPPDQMLGELATYAQRAFDGRQKPITHPISSPDASMQKMLVLLRAQTGHDFSGYKQQTIQRRVARRMAVAQIDELGDYVRYLQQNPLELETLFRDLLIGVTTFFRDPGAWDALQKYVFPRLLTNPTRENVRIWVPACSTGEEAYSLAILIREYLDTARQSCQCQIFATDIDAEAIEKARTGLFAANIEADVAPERLARFFIREDETSTYRIGKTIRDMLMFAAQDVLKDPPFSRVDLISCRNLLIYLSAEAQKSVLQTFHYALRPDGHLFLSTSETIGQLTDLYTQVDRKWKIYQRKAAGPFPMALANPPSFTAGAAASGSALPVEPAARGSVRDLAERVLLDSYVPASVLINDAFEVLYVHGRTGRYLEPAAGEPSMNLLRMAREGLRAELPAAVRRAKDRQTTVRLDGLRVKTNGDTYLVNLIVHPVNRPGVAGGLLAVIFEDATPAAGRAWETMDEPADDQDPHLAALERELRAKEEYLRTVIEELETTNEELKSTNEEAQSANEELQSTNEELSTAKEEMQSVNEELITVNTELQSKIEQLSRANSDISNLLASTNIATLFVDHQLHVQRFTPATSRVISLIQTDVGRPVGDISARFKTYSRLVPDVQGVLDTLIPREMVVQHEDGVWYQMRIQPYRTIDNVIEGAVLTFVDVTTQKRLQLALQESQDRLALLFEVLPVGVSVLNDDGKVIYVNPTLEKILGFTRDELFQEQHMQRPYLRGDGTPMPAEEEPGTRARLEHRAIHHVKVGVRRRDGQTVWTDVSAVPLELPDWKLIVVTFDTSAAHTTQDGDPA